MCGRETKDIYILNVEGVELRACARCAKGKKVIRTEFEQAATRKNESKPSKQLKEEEKPIVENYGAIIRQARERMKIPIKVLAEMLNEKEHYLVRVEEQKTEPNLALARKLEKELKIKLTEESVSENGNYNQKNQKGSVATLGEFTN